MGDFLSDILGTKNKFQSDIAAQNLGGDLQQGNTNFNNNIGNQNALASQLGLQAQGQGPNPALAQLQQTTDQNAKQSAGMIASTKGISPGLAARLAAQNGAMANQQAAGQAATMRAQQQLAAQGQQANVYNQIGNENNQNKSLNESALANQNTINAGVAAGNQKQDAGIIGGIANAAGGFLGLAHGGSVPSNLPDHLGAVADIYHPDMDFRGGGRVPGVAAVPGDSKKNDTVKAMLSPGEEVLPRSVTQSSDPVSKAAQFVKHLQDKKESGYSKVADAKKSLKERVEQLEKLCSGGMVKGMA